MLRLHWFQPQPIATNFLTPEGHGEIVNIAVCFDEIGIMGAEWIARLTGGLAKAALPQLPQINDLAVAGTVGLVIGLLDIRRRNVDRVAIPAIGNGPVEDPTQDGHLAKGAVRVLEQV